MKKPVTSIALVLVMLLSLLAGCGTPAQSSTPAASGADESVVAPEAPVAGEDAGSTAVEPAEPTHEIE